MALKTFFTFSLSQQGAGRDTGVTSNTWARFCKPDGWYTTNGFATLDQSVNCAAQAPVSTFGQTSDGYESGTTAAWGINQAINSNYASSVTAKGWQLAILRSTFSIGAEVWVSMDYKQPESSKASSQSPTTDFLQLFRWGDVSLRMKEVSSSDSVLTEVIAIFNGASEIATVTYKCAVTAWRHIRIHVKLDAATGLIDVTVNGTAQSASYTGQNTVATTSLATATGIHFGPPVWDSGTAFSVGCIANVYFDDAAFCTGRPICRKLVLSGETATGWAAVGTSATTIRDALTSDLMSSSVNNAKAGRGTDAGSDVLFDITAPTTSDLDTNVIGFQIGIGRAHSRNASSARKIGAGISLSGTHNMDSLIEAQALPHSTVDPPPVSGGLLMLAQILEKPAAAGPYVKTDLANIKPRLVIA